MATQDRFDCPSALDLLDYSAGALPKPDAVRIEEHLAQCEGCSDVLAGLRIAQRQSGTMLREISGVYRASDDTSESRSDEEAVRHVSRRLGLVPNEIREAGPEPARRFRALLRQRAPVRTRVGQLWTTGPAPAAETASSPGQEQEHPIVVLLAGESEPMSAGHPAVALAPISLDTEYASDRDVIVPAAESPLGCPFMIEVWNEVTVLREQLSRYLGELQQPLKRSLGLLLLYQAQLGAGVDLGPLQGYLGPAITDERDPRVAFQEQEHERCEALRLPLMRLLGAIEQQTAESPADVVRRLARRHLPSAFPEERPQPEPLTAGHVAARIQADQAVNRTLPASDLMANRRLVGNRAVLPVPVTAQAVARLLESLGVEAGTVYRELFRRTAVRLAMSAQQSEIELAAARRQIERRRPRTPRRPDAEQPE